jgi:uncharacterized FlgJ-related protein
MKWLFRLIFKKELDEVAEITRQAKAHLNIQIEYVNYETFDMESERFLLSILSNVKNPTFLFWILERKRRYDDLIKYGTTANRENNIGRAQAMDELLHDMKIFEQKHNELIAQKAKPNDAE